MYLAVSRPAMVMLVSFLVPKKMPVLGFASLVCSSDLSSEGMNVSKHRYVGGKESEQEEEKDQQQQQQQEG